MTGQDERLHDDERRMLQAASDGARMPDLGPSTQGVFVLLRSRGLLAAGRWDVTPAGAVALAAAATPPSGRYTLEAGGEAHTVRAKAGEGPAVVAARLRKAVAR